MASSGPQVFRIRAVAPAMVAADVSTGAEDAAADAWTQRWRRNEISYLGDRVEELERTLRRRTLLLGSTTALCLAVAVTLGLMAFAQAPVSTYLLELAELVRGAASAWLPSSSPRQQGDAPQALPLLDSLPPPR